MAELLKDMVSASFVELLAKEIGKNTEDFQKKYFLSQVFSEDWESLALKQRYTRIVEMLNRSLQVPYSEQIRILETVAPRFRGLNGIIFPEFVSSYGLSDWNRSMEALRTLTCYSSSEFAVRFFFKKNPEKMLKVMKRWARDTNEHVRRLASEGSRSRLPWSFRLDYMIRHPEAAVPILERLKNDDSLYVRKSVANHVNDISKDHPEVALNLAADWFGKSEKTDWIVKHGLRTLLKSGNKKALGLFGFSNAKGVSVSNLRMIDKKVRIGRHVEFHFDLSHGFKGGKNVRIEYAIHYMKKNGTLSRKVFKLSERTFPAGVTKIKRKHSMKQMTTRTHFVGEHKVEVLINGRSMAMEEFFLT